VSKKCFQKAKYKKQNPSEAIYKNQKYITSAKYPNEIWLYL